MITGVADVTGAYIAIRSAKSGYHVAVLAKEHYHQRFELKKTSY